MTRSRQRRLTASALWRAFICLGSTLLERIPYLTEFSERGSKIHAYLLDVNRIAGPKIASLRSEIPVALAEAREEALALVKDEKLREACALIDIEKLPLDPTAYAAEVAFAVDILTGRARELGRGLTREEAYARATETEVVGTADVVALLGDRVIVIDYKTGYKDLPAPAVNWQFKFLALAAARAFGRHGAIVELVRIREDGEAYKIGGELGALDLAEIAEDVRDLYCRQAEAAEAMENGAPPPLVVGAHCKGCECSSSCPEAKGLVQMALISPQSLVGMADPLTPAQKSEALEQALALFEFAEKLVKRVKQMSAAEPIPTRDGRWYYPISEARTKPSGLDLFRALEERLGNEEAWKLVEITSTWKTLEGLARAEVEAARKGGKKLYISHLMKDLRADLARRGAVKTWFVDDYGPHKALPKDGQ